MRRYRSALPALLVGGSYAMAIAVAALVALIEGDLHLLGLLTLFYEGGEGAVGTLPTVLVLASVGGLIAWTLWQCLRGPEIRERLVAGKPAGGPPVADRQVRWLRVALYASAGCLPLSTALPWWPWWAAVLSSLLLLAVVVLFQPALWHNVGLAGLALLVGGLSTVGAAAVAVFDVLGWRTWERMAAPAVIGYLVWMVLVLSAQWRDGRWKRTTVRYGAASLLMPVVLMFVLLPFRSAVDVDVVDVLTTAYEFLAVIWMTRSAHELAGSPGWRRPQRLPLTRPPAFPVAVRLTACVVLLLPPMVNVAGGHSLWITPHVPIEWLTRRVGDVPVMLWSAFELFVGIGGLAIVALVATHKGTALAVRLAVGALLTTAMAGVVAVALFESAAEDAAGFPLGRLGPDGSADPWSLFTRNEAVSPLWFSAACVASVILLLLAYTLHAHGETSRGRPLSYN